MGLNRCHWCLGDPLYQKYHDTEWGKPVTNDKQLFEFLFLECFQAGLSWITILRKREHFRTAFDHFDYQTIAQYNTEKVKVLLQNPNIVRNKLKIQASITNAQNFIKIQQQYGSFSAYIWAFVKHKPIVNYFENAKQVPAFTPLAEIISKDLKKRGFKFVGSTIIYAFMQATGMVNDHITSCFRHAQLQ